MHLPERVPNLSGRWDDVMTKLGERRSALEAVVAGFSKRKPKPA